MSLLDRVRQLGRQRSSASVGSGPRAAGEDAVRLVIEYLKQETLGPLKGLGRFLAFGISGAVLLAFGVILLLVGLLRALQTETGSTFAGNLSWLPYGIVAVAALLVAAFSVWRATRGSAARHAAPEAPAGSASGKPR